jgi:hypothetical protein
MRKIEFKSSVSGMTKIFVDGKELNTALDLKALRQVRLMKSKLPPATGQNIIDITNKKLGDDVLNLTKEEIMVILKYVKEEINM